MTTEQDYQDLPEASHEAVHAARDHAQKVELAREVQTNRVAKATVDEVSASIGNIVRSNIEHVLARGTEQEKSIILARVPYICQDIKGIDQKLENIVTMMEQVKKDLDVKDKANKEENDRKYVNHDQFGPYKWVLTIIAGAVITGLVGAFMALVIIPKVVPH